MNRFPKSTDSTSEASQSLLGDTSGDGKRESVSDEARNQFSKVLGQFAKRKKSSRASADDGKGDASAYQALTDTQEQPQSQPTYQPPLPPVPHVPISMEMTSMLHTHTLNQPAVTADEGVASRSGAFHYHQLGDTADTLPRETKRKQTERVDAAATTTTSKPSRKSTVASLLSKFNFGSQPEPQLKPHSPPESNNGDVSARQRKTSNGADDAGISTALSQVRKKESKEGLLSGQNKLDEKKSASKKGPQSVNDFRKEMKREIAHWVNILNHYETREVKGEDDATTTKVQEPTVGYQLTGSMGWRSKILIAALSWTLAITSNILVYFPLNLYADSDDSDHWKRFMLVISLVMNIPLNGQIGSSGLEALVEDLMNIVYCIFPPRDNSGNLLRPRDFGRAIRLLGELVLKFGFATGAGFMYAPLPMKPKEEGSTHYMWENLPGFLSNPEFLFMYVLFSFAPLNYRGGALLMRIIKQYFVKNPGFELAKLLPTIQLKKDWILLYERDCVRKNFMAQLKAKYARVDTLIGQREIWKIPERLAREGKSEGHTPEERDAVNARALLTEAHETVVQKYRNDIDTDFNKFCCMRPISATISTVDTSGFFHGLLRIKGSETSDGHFGYRAGAYGLVLTGLLAYFADAFGARLDPHLIAAVPGFLKKAFGSAESYLTASAFATSLTNLALSWLACEDPAALVADLVNSFDVIIKNYRKADGAPTLRKIRDAIDDKDSMAPQKRACLNKVIHWFDQWAPPEIANSPTGASYFLVSIVFAGFSGYGSAGLTNEKHIGGDLFNKVFVALTYPGTGLFNWYGTSEVLGRTTLGVLITLAIQASTRELDLNCSAEFNFSVFNQRYFRALAKEMYQLTAERLNRLTDDEFFKMVYAHVLDEENRLRGEPSDSKSAYKPPSMPLASTGDAPVDEGDRKLESKQPSDADLPQRVQVLQNQTKIRELEEQIGKLDEEIKAKQEEVNGLEKAKNAAEAKLAAEEKEKSEGTDEAMVAEASDEKEAEGDVSVPKFNSDEERAFYTASAALEGLQIRKGQAEDQLSRLQEDNKEVTLEILGASVSNTPVLGLYGLPEMLSNSFDSVAELKELDGAVVDQENEDTFNPVPTRTKRILEGLILGRTKASGSETDFYDVLNRDGRYGACRALGGDIFWLVETGVVALPVILKLAGVIEEFDGVYSSDVNKQLPASLVLYLSFAATPYIKLVKTWRQSSKEPNPRNGYMGLVEFSYSEEKRDFPAALEMRVTSKNDVELGEATSPTNGKGDAKTSMDIEQKEPKDTVLDSTRTGFEDQGVKQQNCACRAVRLFGKYVIQPVLAPAVGMLTATLGNYFCSQAGSSEVTAGYVGFIAGALTTGVLANKVDISSPAEPENTNSYTP